MTIPNLDCKGLLHIIKLPSNPGTPCFSSFGSPDQNTPCFCRFGNTEKSYLSYGVEIWLRDELKKLLNSESTDIKIWVILTMSVLPIKKEEINTFNTNLRDIRRIIIKSIVDKLGAKVARHYADGIRDMNMQKEYQISGFYLSREM